MIKYLLMVISFCYLFSLSLIAQTENPVSYINDSTIARYRYELIQHLYAQVPSGTNIQQVHFSERDLLKPIIRHQIITTGINNAFEPFYQIQNLKSTVLEDWMSVPELQLITPSGSFGFDSVGKQSYYFTNNEEENQDISNQTQAFATEGFQPIMLFFPTKRDAFVQEAQNQGAVLYDLPQNAFKLSMPEEELIIEPNEKRISHHYIQDSTQIESLIEYTLYAPYGYVPIWEKEKKWRLDLLHPVTFVTQTSYFNHVIEDLNSRIEKYTDKAYLEIYPNPIEEDFEVILRGIPEAQISQLQVRDHLGNIIQTHINPTVNQDIIHLNASSYPAGVLILIVYSQYGVYTETFTKI